MSRRSGWLLGLTLAPLTQGCLTMLLPENDPATDPLPTCDNTPLMLAPGQAVEGQDPEALFARYLGSWSGTLTWMAGGETTFELGASRGAQPAYAGLSCNVPTSVYTSPEMTVVTGDGAFDQTGLGHLSVGLDGGPRAGGEDDQSPLTPCGLPQRDWTSALPARLPVDSARYTAPLLSIELEYPPHAVAPVSAMVTFSGEHEAVPDSHDFLVVATVAFE
ncbi:MAG: hypothetical protein JW751_18210 [Polyangiaceae bacterium]|nr:hypothetical protein [Polyangiaceae bacterium]